MQNSTIEYFNLFNDGDNATVRLLHTSTDTIEQVDVHTIEIGEEKKKRSVKCPGEGCPLCKLGDKPNHRIYVHLWDYADNKEKIWIRTDKIMDKLIDIQVDWGDLNECVLKIKRIGNQFPKYEINVLNANNFAKVDKALNDKKLSYRFYLTRTADELKEFVTNGVLPEHKSNFIPKEEYKKMKEAERQAQKNTQIENKLQEKVVEKKQEPVVDDDDPFMDAFITKPRKV